MGRYDFPKRWVTTFGPGFIAKSPFLKS